MSLLSKVISNLFNGVSQQPAELRDGSQAAAQVNAISSPAYGLRKRPGTTSIAKVGSTALEPLVHFINRDKDEQYAVLVSEGNIQVFNATTGAELQVSKPDGTDYLRDIDPQADLRLVSVADHTFVLNTKRPVQLSGELLSDADSLSGTVSFPIPAIKFPVIDPTDPTKTPGPGGTITPPTPLPGYGGGGGSTYGDYPSLPGSTDKPKDPTNPTKVPLTLALASATLPEGKKGASYASFSFRSLLTISGDAGNDGVISWTTFGVPDGLSVSEGVLSGTPTAKGISSFTVTATYKGLSASNTYSLVVSEVVWVTKDPSGNWTDPNAAQNGGTGAPGEAQTGYGFTLPNARDALPSYLGDGNLMARLVSQGLDANHYVVLYRPSLTLTVEGDPSATDLRRYFPMGVTTYGGATNTGTLGAFSSVFMNALLQDQYSIRTTFTNGYYVNESFPQMVVKDDSRDFGETLTNVDIMKTQNAVMYTGVADGGSESTVNVFTAVAFDACFIVPVNGKFVVTGGQTSLEPNLELFELPVRVSITGVRPIALNSDPRINLFCGRVEDYYQDGGFLYNPATFQTDIPIRGFTREIHRLITTESSPPGTSLPLSRMSLSRYGSVLYGGEAPGGFLGRKVAFLPPLAYNILPRDGLTKSTLGPYAYVLRKVSNGLTPLTQAELALIPN